MPEHVECSLRLISRYHMTRVIYKHEPKVLVDLSPTMDLSVDCPDYLLGSLPHGGSLPVQ